MLKICDSGMVEPLTIIFNSCVNQSMFPDIWKKSNICPIHKKGDTQTISNYRPVSLLPVCGKIFERLIFSSLYKYLEEKQTIISPSIWLSIKWCMCKSAFVNCIFFLTYINDLSNSLLSTVKLFAEYTSLFYVVNDSNISANELNKVLQKISKWADR